VVLLEVKRPLRLPDRVAGIRQAQMVRGVLYLDFNLIEEPGTAESVFYAQQFRVIFAGQRDGRIEVIPFGGPD
jgi:hypothetical protein